MNSKKAIEPDLGVLDKRGHPDVLDDTYVPKSSRSIRALPDTTSYAYSKAAERTRPPRQVLEIYVSLNHVPRLTLNSECGEARHTVVVVGVAGDVLHIYDVGLRSQQ